MKYHYKVAGPAHKTLAMRLIAFLLALRLCDASNEYASRELRQIVNTSVF